MDVSDMSKGFRKRYAQRTGKGNALCNYGCNNFTRNHTQRSSYPWVKFSTCDTILCTARDVPMGQSTSTLPYALRFPLAPSLPTESIHCLRRFSAYFPLRVGRRFAVGILLTSSYVQLHHAPTFFCLHPTPTSTKIISSQYNDRSCRRTSTTHQSSPR